MSCCLSKLKEGLSLLTAPSQGTSNLTDLQYKNIKRVKWEPLDV